MKLALLERRHPELDAPTLERYRLLVDGGAALRRRMREVLPRHDVEPAEVYARRVAAAGYLNYAAPIVNALASWLFTGPSGVRTEGTESEDLPAWAGALRDRATGTEDLAMFLRRRVADALVARRAYWQVEAPDAPPGLSMAEWQRRGLDRVRLRPVPTAEVTHWSRDDEGRFVWLLERTECVELESFLGTERRVLEWTLWSHSAPPRRWRLELDPKRPPTPETEVPETPETELPRTPGVPFVCLDLPLELWMMNLVADPLVEITRKRNALSWAIDRVCYAMPVLYSASKKPVSAMGAGYLLQLGKDDKLEFPAPPSTPFDVIEAHIRALKDELYRVVQQMAAGVENNAAAVGRSGESKSADARSTEVVLRALGALVRDAMERTFDLAAERLGVSERFSAFGLDTFALESVASLVEVIEGVERAGLTSPTLRTELRKDLARRALPHAPGTVLAAIDAEIVGAATDPATAHRSPTAPIPGAARPSPPTTGGEDS